MTKERLVIAVVIAVLIGIIVFRGGGEPPEPQATSPSSGRVDEGTRGPRSWQPSATPSQGAWPGTQAPAPLQGYQDGSYPRPVYPGYTESFPAQAPSAPYARENLQFRPLSERERQRIERQSRGSSGPYNQTPDQWQPWHPRATSPEPAYGDYPGALEPWGPGWDHPDWGTEGFSLRPVEPAKGARKQGEGPYSSPARPGEDHRPEPDPFQIPPQWGVVPPQRVPPSYRMYPSLDLPRDRKLTAR